MTKPTPFSARHFLGEQFSPEEATQAAAIVLQGGDSHASADIMPGIPPILLSQTIGGTAARTTIDLTFSTTMRAGSGAIYITDGAVQTVLDSSGMPSLRIVGANDTREIAPSSLHFSGEHVLIDGIDLLAGHHYSVVISPGALQSTESKAFAGVRSPGTIAFSTTTAPTGDTTGPTLDAIHLNASKLKAGQDILVTLTFSEKIATPSLAAFSTPHAELQNLHSDDGITWYATLKASAAAAAVANAFTVDMSQIRDLAGNAGRGTPPSATYDVDSMVAAWVVPHMSLMDDEGPDDEDLITHGSTQDLVGGIVGHIESGQHFELLINGVAVASESITLHGFTEGSFTGYSWVYTGPVPTGTNTVVARVVDSAGHSSAEYTRTIVIDNTAPAMTSTADGSTEFNPTSAIVINFSEPMYWQPSEGSDSMFEVRDGFGNTSHVAFSLAQLSSDGRTLTIPASAHQFVAGADYRITLPATLTDIAGNGVGEHDIRLHTAGTYVDTMPPRAISAHVDTLSGVYGVGSVIEIHVVMNEEVVLAGSAAPSLGLNNHATATFVSISGKELVFQYQVGVGQDVSLLEVTDWTTLVNSVADRAGNKLSVVEFTHLENSSADMPGTSGIEIDTTNPAMLAAPLLSADSDSATKGDFITSDNTPTISGSGAEPGNAVHLYWGESRVATLFADDHGNWSYTPASPLADGVHVFSVRQEDSAGNRSPYSSDLRVKVDTVASAPTLAMDAASDTGTVGDNITGVPSPTIKGSAEAGALVKLYDGTTLIGSATADASGNWSIVPSALSSGSHLLTARQTDIAGNVSDASVSLAVTIDGNAPATLAS
ncbi:MAG TPA: Ig-like domain-containing protein, partial [Telluria sp.]|nr:Ig-like domain-containing protein [Telluria sp.]